MNRSGSTVVLMIIVMAASPALGGEGVMEINQACAVHTGCFAGDDAGYPVTIVTSGSYLLTGNLEVSEIDVSAITVAAEDVTIDLRGFEIRGPITGCPSGCSGGGTGDGIVIDPSTLPNDAQGTTIRNGTVRGFASGVAVSTSNMLVEGVRSLENAFVGLFAGPGSTVVNSHAVSNGVAGFVGNGNSIVFERCVSRHNGRSGFEGAGELRGCTTEFNASFGVQGSRWTIIESLLDRDEVGAVEIDEGSIVDSRIYHNSPFSPSSSISCAADCLIESNHIVNTSTGDGVVVGPGSRVAGNTIRVAGAFGIEAGDGASVWGNSLNGAVTGLVATPTVGYSDNVFFNNTTDVTGGVNAGGNVCGGVPCP